MLLCCVVGRFLFACLVCFPRFRDQYCSLTKLNDHLSCHGAHGMGEKKHTVSNNTVSLMCGTLEAMSLWATCDEDFMTLCRGCSPLLS